MSNKKMRGIMNDKVKTLAITVAILTPVAAWFTHVVTCLANGTWLGLIAGAILFPIGIIHGIGIWFGVW